MSHELSSATTGPQALTVLAQYPASVKAIPASERIHVLKAPNQQAAAHAPNVFVFALATQLQAVAGFVSLANRRHQLRALFVRDDLDPYWVPRFIERAGLRTLRNTVVHSDLTIPRRVLNAWAHGAQDQLIADARIANHHLYVTSCALDQYDVTIKKLAPLRDLSDAAPLKFEIDEDGSYIHWPGPDVHLDLDAIRVAIDPQLRTQARRLRALHDSRYGRAVSQLRKDAGLNQSQLRGLSERQVRRIENGESVTVRALAKLAQAHHLKLDEYLNRLAERFQAEEQKPATNGSRRFVHQTAARQHAARANGPEHARTTRNRHEDATARAHRLTERAANTSVRGRGKQRSRTRG